MKAEKKFGLLWFEDGSSIPLDYLLVDGDGKKHLARTDINGICPLYDFLGFEFIRSTEKEVMDLIHHELFL